MKRALRVLAVASIAAAAMLSAACGDDSTSKDRSRVVTSPRQGSSKLVLIAADDPGTLDYVQSNLTALTLWIPRNVVEPLLILDQDGKPGPGVADKWEISEDQKTYTFHIRNAKFSDGSPVTTADVVYSLETMRDSPVGANKTPYQAVTSIKALDDRRVEVRLSRPSLAFLQGMGSVAGIIQPKAAAGAIATKPVGTGPYEVKKYVQDHHIEFVANPNYWGPKPSIHEIEVKFISDPTAALNALKAGEADAYPYVSEDLFERITKEGLDKTFSLETYPQAGNVFFLAFNTTKAPYSDPKLRHALVKAIDRKSFADAFNAPWGLVPTCTYRAAAEPSLANCVDPYDPAKARQELANAGYANEQIEFTSVTNLSNLVAPADIAVASFQAAGAKVTRNQMDLARFAQVVFNGKPPQHGVTVMTTEYNITQMASCPDPTKTSWRTYCDADITALLARADAATTKEEQLSLFRQADRKLQEDAVLVPIMTSKGAALLNRGLTGWQQPKVTIAIELASMHWVTGQ